MSQPQSPSSPSQPQPAHQPQLPPHYYYQQPQDDEIDLRELFAALWQGKWIIIASMIICTALATTYALLAKEQWSSTAKIAKPQVSDYSEYQNQVIQFQPIFDVYQEDGTVLISNALDSLTNSDNLYNLFLDDFNSSSNKREFLETSSVFKSELTKADGNENALRKLYNEWNEYLSIKPQDENKINGPYILSASAETSQQSLVMLNDYISFIDRKVHEKALNNLKATLYSKKNELKQQLIMLVKQAEQRLSVEKERSEYALKIAEAAGVNKPLQNFAENELFAINLGGDALKAKLDALTKVKNLSVIEPRLEQLNSKIKHINNMDIDNNIKFYSYRYLNLPERNFLKNKPKRLLIVISGFLIGVILGVIIIFINRLFCKKD